MLAESFKPISTTTSSKMESIQDDPALASELVVILGRELASMRKKNEALEAQVTQNVELFIFLSMLLPKEI